LGFKGGAAAIGEATLSSVPADIGIGLRFEAAIAPVSLME
jgi:hypothetical protein